MNKEEQIKKLEEESQKVKIKKVKEAEVPYGDYCQRADGNISCQFYGWEFDPFFGSGFKCGFWNQYLDVPNDGLKISANRDVLKCDKCKNYREEKG